MEICRFLKLLTKLLIDKSISWKTAIPYCFWVVTALLLTLLSLTTLPATRSFISIINFKSNYTRYLKHCSKIVNSCNLDNFNPKVAMVVSTCNDVLASAILQTAKQTYKIAIWYLFLIVVVYQKKIFLAILRFFRNSINEY